MMRDALSKVPALWRTPTEPHVLALSVGATFVMALLGVLLGIVANSQAIIFDGIFAVIDGAMTVLSLVVARLLQRDGSRRFQYGYWHLEPLTAAFNGSVLLLLCVYAIIDGIRGLIAGGGAEVSLGVAATYSAIVCLICVVCYGYQIRVNRRLKSELIRIDMNSFLMSACITTALFVGFAVATLVEHLGYPAFGPYADSMVLLILACGLLPIPARIVFNAMRDVFMIAPEALHAQVRDVVAAAVKRYRFIGFTSYVAKSGRMYVVDIHIQVPVDYCVAIADYDRVRGEIAEGLGPAFSLRQWLSISFTARHEWT